MLHEIVFAHEFTSGWYPNHGITSIDYLKTTPSKNIGGELYQAVPKHQEFATTLRTFVKSCYKYFSLSLRTRKLGVFI